MHVVLCNFCRSWPHRPPGLMPSLFITTASQSSGNLFGQLHVAGVIFPDTTRCITEEDPCTTLASLHHALTLAGPGGEIICHAAFCPDHAGHACLRTLLPTVATLQGTHAYPCPISNVLLNHSPTTRSSCSDMHLAPHVNNVNCREGA